MIENFKIVAKELRRQLKISVFLPDDYNENENTYPLIYSLDGEYLYPDGTITDEKINLTPTMYNNVVIVGIHAPSNPDWRISEIGAYYDPINNTQADFTLMNNFGEYLSKILNPLIIEKYRINNKKIAIIGYNDGALFPLYEINNYKEFSYAGIFSPALDKTYPHTFDLIKANYRCDAYIYLYVGGIDNINVDSSYKLFTLFDKLGNQNIKLSYEEKKGNHGIDFENEFINFIDFVIKA